MPNYVIDVRFIQKGSFSINAKSEDEAYNWVNNLETYDLAVRTGLDKRNTVDEIYFDIDSDCTDEEDRPEDDTVGVNA